MDESKEEQKNIYMSDDLKKAKTKFFSFSLLIIFITIFEPSMTGFLGNFSIKVKNYPDLFVIVIYFILFWLYFRYILLLTNEFEELESIFNPIKLINKISLTWFTELEKLHQYKERVDSDIKYLKARGVDNPIKHFKTYKEGDTVQLSDNSTYSISSEANVYAHYQRMKRKLTNLKGLAFTDIIFPSIIWGLALLSLLQAHLSGYIVQKIHAQQTQLHAEYKIDSATLEVKDIKLKQLNTGANP